MRWGSTDLPSPIADLKSPISKASSTILRAAVLAAGFEPTQAKARRLVRSLRESGI